jgi:hypothetical protein
VDRLKRKSLSFQRQNESLEVIYRQDYKKIDSIEFNLNSPKDRKRLLEYVRQKLGLSFSKKEEQNIHWW